MMYGDYSLEFDRTGFPLVRRNDWNYSISLFPVSKYQFERFIVEHGPKGELYTDKWYRENLRINPRRPWFRCEERQWELFITGLGYDEIVPFLRYLGSGFRLPKEKEWLSLLEASGEIRKIIKFERDCPENCAPPVSLWVKKGLFSLVEEGILEMLSESDGCIGKPYLGLLPNTWKPGKIKNVNWDICRHVIGFRVVRV